jgi:replicative DNA helicase
VLNDDSTSYIRDLVLITPTSANAIEYAQIVKDKSLLRAIADTGSDINAMAITGEGGADNILEAAEKKVYSLRQGRDREELQPISKVLLETYEQINKASKDGSGIPGLATGLYDLDHTIMGLNKSDFILIASRPGMGKTSIALNIALHVARTSDKAVAVFSLEMSCEQLALRLLSSESYIDGKKLQTGRLHPDEWQRLIDAAASISKAKLLISDKAAITVSDMNAQCRRVPDLGLVIVDYLQLMQSASSTRGYSSENRVQVVSEITRMMKIMAKELNVPVVCLSQLSRETEKRTQNKRPQLSDLRDSGSIEQDADIVLGLYRDEYYNKEAESHIAECIVLKNRRGETKTIELQWMPEFTTYTSLEKRYDED